MPRLDLNEAEIRLLVRAMDRAATTALPYILSEREIDQIKRLCGEVLRLRDQDAQRHFLAGIEGAY